MHRIELLSPDTKLLLSAYACKRSCKLDGSTAGGGLVVLRAGTVVSAVSCTLSRNAANGAQLTDGAQLKVHSCTIQYSGMDGMILVGAGTSLTATDTTSSSNGRAGATIINGAAADFRACQLLCNVHGLLVMSSREVRCMSCCISKSSQSNVEMKEGAMVSLREVECERSKGVGCSIAGTKSRLEATLSKVQSNNDSNIILGAGGAVVCTDCAIDGSARGGGLGVLEGPCAAKANNCSISNNMLSNVQVLGGVAGLRGCTLQGSVEAWGLVVVGRSAVATASDCRISGNRLANVRAENRALITLENCHVGAED